MNRHMLKWPLYARIEHTARGRFKRVADASRRTDGDEQKYVYNPGRVTFAHFCARVRRRRS